MATAHAMATMTSTARARAAVSASSTHRATATNASTMSTPCVRHHSSYPIIRRRRTVARAADDAETATATTTGSADTTAEAPLAAALDWRYETIAGRCAMVGYAVGASREVTEQLSYADQVFAHAFGTVVVCGAIAWASVKPFEFNPQEYNADPRSLDGKKGMSGFLAMEALNFNVDVERLNGRACMVGIVGTMLVEAVCGCTIF